MKNIILIGFMGTGKSAVARYLQEQYDMQVIDIDRKISEEASLTIPEIFEQFGEEYFRQLETEAIIDVQSSNNAVISCGGGAVLKEENVVELRKCGTIVLLTASPEVILERVKWSKERPLLEGNKNVDFIKRMMEARCEKYEKAADVIIDTSKKAIIEIGEEILKKVIGIS